MAARWPLAFNPPPRRTVRGWHQSVHIVASTACVKASVKVSLVSIFDTKQWMDDLYSYQVVYIAHHTPVWHTAPIGGTYLSQLVFVCRDVWSASWKQGCGCCVRLPRHRVVLLCLLVLFSYEWLYPRSTLLIASNMIHVARGTAAAGKQLVL